MAHPREASIHAHWRRAESPVPVSLLASPA